MRREPPGALTAAEGEQERAGFEYAAGSRGERRRALYHSRCRVTAALLPEPLLYGSVPR